MAQPSGAQLLDRLRCLIIYAAVASSCTPLPAAPGAQAEEAAAEAEALRAAARSTTVEVHMVNEEAGSQVKRAFLCCFGCSVGPLPRCTCSARRGRRAARNAKDGQRRWQLVRT